MQIRKVVGADDFSDSFQLRLCKILPHDLAGIISHVYKHGRFCAPAERLNAHLAGTRE